MEEKIKEVLVYFKNKLLTNDFEISTIEQHTMNLLVDGKYLFVIWMANDDYALSIYDKSFVHFTLNDKERKKIYSLLKGKFQLNKQNIVLAQKRKELAALEKQINSLEQK